MNSLNVLIILFSAYHHLLPSQASIPVASEAVSDNPDFQE